MIELCKQIPAVAALIFLVIQFLHSIEKRDAVLNNIRKEWSDAMSTVVKDAAEVTERNTDAMIKVYSVIAKCPRMKGEEQTDGS